jgi:hypothetical protein
MNQFKAIRSKIDSYIEQEVQKKVLEKVHDVSKDMVQPLAERFLHEHLESFLERYLQAAVEKVLAGMEDVFDSDVEEAYNPVAPDTGKVCQTPATSSKKAIRVLACIQLNPNQTLGEDTEIPHNRYIQEQLGLSSSDVRDAFEHLVAEGYLENLQRVSGHKRTVLIKKPLVNPQNYITQ